MKVKVTDIHLNPENPRFIKDEKYEQLKKSISDFPEMLEVRKIIINDDFMVLGGDKRYRAAKELGYKELEVDQVSWPHDKQAEFIAKDNIHNGDWDYEKLANQYDADELLDWGLELPGVESAGKEDKPKTPTISVTFDDISSMENAMVEISELASQYGGQAKTNV